MDKLLDKLLIEFLVPAVLMLLCLVLAVDIFSCSKFNLPDHYRNLDATIWIFGLVIAYILNTSISASLNIMLRPLLWGKTREYLIYRKLNLFKEPTLEAHDVSWWKYVLKSRQLKKAIENAKKKDDINLYKAMTARMQDKGIPECAYTTPYDLYDVVRTVVMTSQDNGMIAWIQHHWAQLRLTRSTLVPTFILVTLAPLALHTWGASTVQVVSLGVFVFLFFVFQLVHYYYREKFMIYAMLGYLFVLPYKEGSDERRQHSDVL
jgi:hypothetical protein